MPEHMCSKINVSNINFMCKICQMQVHTSLTHMYFLKINYNLEEKRANDREGKGKQS